jgi:hypothetical protein
MELPDVFDLTPAIFNPPFLPAEVLATPFSVLNATNWPFRSASVALFDFLIETDPFVIADIFWGWVDGVAAIVRDLAGGGDVEIGFDTIFPCFLVAIFAFGVGEILEAFAFCGAFLEWETDARRQFAMTHCLGIVAYIEKMDVDGLRARFGSSYIVSAPESSTHRCICPS